MPGICGRDRIRSGNPETGKIILIYSDEAKGFVLDSFRNSGEPKADSPELPPGFDFVRPVGSLSRPYPGGKWTKLRALTADAWIVVRSEWENEQCCNSLAKK